MKLPSPGSRGDIASFGLTDREAELLSAVAEGLSNKEIPDKLYLGEGTVRNYISSLLEKLSLRDRTQLAVFYYKHAAIVTIVGMASGAENIWVFSLNCQRVFLCLRRQARHITVDLRAPEMKLTVLVLDVLFEAALAVGVIGTGDDALRRVRYRLKHIVHYAEIAVRGDFIQERMFIRRSPARALGHTAPDHRRGYKRRPHDGQYFPANLIQKLLWNNSFGLKKFGAMTSIVTAGFGLYGPPVRIGTDSEIVQIDVE